MDLQEISDFATVVGGVAGEWPITYLGFLWALKIAFCFGNWEFIFTKQSTVRKMVVEIPIVDKGCVVPSDQKQIQFTR